MSRLCKACAAQATRTASRPGPPENHLHPRGLD